MSGKKRIVIANAGGFWGDDPTAAGRQVRGGPIDYLVMDYLAEVTMAILQKQRVKDPKAGYAKDFLTQLREVLPTCAEKGIKIIANAGGVNPLACRDAVEALAKELGVADKIKVGLVIGDDLMGDLDGLLSSGEPLSHMDTKKPLADVRKEVVCANAYLGAAPIVKALEMGANLIIAGRVTDTAVTLGPMMHEFGWAYDDWDKIATGVIAGHIIECGTQCTGGNFSDWEKVKSYKDLGFPLIEANADGTFVVTKHPGTGGLVSVHTVTEQLLYEMGSTAYLSPDCTAHFDSIKLEQDGPDRVKVSGARGAPPPPSLKVSIGFMQGYRAFGRLIVSGPDALAKAKRVAAIFWECAGGESLYDHTVTQFFGWDACHAPLATEEPGEIMVQVGVRDRDEKKINHRFGPQLVPRVLGGVPGMTYLGDQGRPRASDVVGYWPALVTRERVKVRVVVADKDVALPDPAAGRKPEAFAAKPFAPPAFKPSGKTVKTTLQKLCLARSGDKGDTANVGVIARSPAIYAWMRDELTTAFVKKRFAETVKGGVDRFEVPNLLGLNFLLHQSLGGGGTLSLLIDAQGKTYSQFLLATPVTVDEALLATSSP